MNEKNIHAVIEILECMKMISDKLRRFQRTVRGGQLKRESEITVLPRDITLITVAYYYCDIEVKDRNAILLMVTLNASKGMQAANAISLTDLGFAPMRNRTNITWDQIKILAIARLPSVDEL